MYTVKIVTRVLYTEGQAIVISQIKRGESTVVIEVLVSHGVTGLRKWSEATVKCKNRRILDISGAWIVVLGAHL